MSEHQWVPGEIFVFGSNLSGIHGAGAALFAKQNCGAIIGLGEGPSEDSFAIPTKGRNLERRTPHQIYQSVRFFVAYALAHPEKKFFVTRIGCGLAGYRDEDIAPMFKDVPDNCRMPPEWEGKY